MDTFGFSSAQTLQALSNLLNPKLDEDDDDDGYRSNARPSAHLGPGNIGPQSKTDAPKEEKTVTMKDIWGGSEVVEDDEHDPRPKPEYEMILKQCVGTEDLFLGLSRKDPSSMCCESLLIKIKLPDTKASDVVLDVKEKFLDLQTPNYKLGLHLPHPVHHRDGKAQFFSEREELEVTLLMNRPMDVINLP